MTTKIPVELSSTPGIVDGSNATAITIDSSERVGIGTTSPSVPLDIVTALSSDTQSTPETVLTLATKYTATTGVDGAAGAGARLEFKIPDDETNPITGAAIAGIKENGDDSDASAGMAFYISQNDTTLDEAVRIDHDGNVGIGTTSPSSIFHVVAEGNNGQRVHVGTSSAHQIYLGNTGGVSSVGTLSNHNFQIITNGSSRAVVDTSGNVGIGTTDPQDLLHVETTASPIASFRYNANNRVAIRYDGFDIYGGGMVFRIAGTEMMQLSTGGNLGVGDNSPAYRLELPNTASSAGQGRANAWVTYSDSRIKSNIQTLSYGLDIVKQLKPSQYKHHNSIKEDGQFVKQDEGTNDIGFIAQEVLPLIPEVVGIPEDTDKDLYSINYPKLTAVLTKAIQEQQEQIEQLKTEIQTLKGE